MDRIEFAKAKASLTQEELNWLSDFFKTEKLADSQRPPIEGEFTSNFENILYSLKKGYFVKTKQNVDLVKSVLTKLGIAFDDEDLELEQ